ncbi:MAG: GldG family protein [Granulosicoccaceae bacterium]|jgi:ABC-type uncharacterized transport system involved in gliding motility auxiliary subunit
MRVTTKSKRQLRIQNVIFYVLFAVAIGLIATLATRYHASKDMTASGRNTLSAASINLLGTLDAPVRLRAFAHEDATAAQLRTHITDMVERYRKAKPDITLEFVNPELEPQLTRDLGIRSEGEIVISYKGRSEHVQQLSEQSLSNALQRMARSGERFVVFLAGHGERLPTGRANHDLGDFGKQLEAKGFRVQPLNLATSPSIPDNTSVLVIASPQVDLLPGEATLLNRYLDAGGNLLWLAEPGSTHGLDGLAERLGIEFHPGMIVDPTTQLLGIQDPRFTLIGEYALHPITDQFANVTLYPQAVGMEIIEGSDWQVQPLLITAANSWMETGEMTGALALDAGEDIPGPLTLGAALTRERSGKDTEAGSEQRLVVIGDGDFLSNAYLGNAGNLDLGLNVFNWLSRDDNLIDIPARTTPDRSLALSRTSQGAIGLGFLLVVPLALLGTGVLIWWRRRRA